MACVEVKILQKEHWINLPDYEYPEMTGYEGELYRLTTLYDLGEGKYADLSQAQIDKKIAQLNDVLASHESVYDIFEVTNWDHYSQLRPDYGDPNYRYGMNGLYNLDGTWTGQIWRGFGYPNALLLIVGGVSIYDTFKVGPDTFKVGDLASALQDETGKLLLARKFSASDIVPLLLWTDGVSFIDAKDFSKTIKIK